MNGFSLGELCWLFCCPPCPSRIAAKLAFLPPEPTYTVLQPDLHLSERADWQYSQRELDAVEVFFSRTARDNRLGCMFVRCAPTGRYTLLFSHGNAVDLGQMCSFYIGLGSRINCNVFSYDYSGYGVSTGKPSEKNLYADIDAAWQDGQTFILGLFLDLGVYSAVLYVSHCLTIENLHLEQEVLRWLGAKNLLFETCPPLSMLRSNPGEPELWLNLAVAWASVYPETAGALWCVGGFTRAWVT
uniref:Alpha/beta hydrolase domain-containing protein 17C n=1 Tax=Accipiter nisus TaxID=211598 RepID=A0A8B9NFE2_9AVES